MSVVEASKEAALKEQILSLKQQVNSLDGNNVRLSKDLGAAQKELAALTLVNDENADLRAVVKALNDRIGHLDAALKSQQANQDKADAVIAAGKAVKAGLALLG